MCLAGDHKSLNTLEYPWKEDPSKKCIHSFIDSFIQNEMFDFFPTKETEGNRRHLYYFQGTMQQDNPIENVISWALELLLLHGPILLLFSGSIPRRWVWSFFFLS